MSPEMIQIDKEANIDYKTDIWSFGCVVYEMITLEKAFKGSDIITIKQKILNEEYEIPQTMNGDTKNLIEK